jgi:hypothetical protein
MSGRQDCNIDSPFRGNWSFIAKSLDSAISSNFMDGKEGSNAYQTLIWWIFDFSRCSRVHLPCRKRLSEWMGSDPYWHQDKHMVGRTAISDSIMIHPLRMRVPHHLGRDAKWPQHFCNWRRIGDGMNSSLVTRYVKSLNLIAPYYFQFRLKNYLKFRLKLRHKFKRIYLPPPNK